VTIGVFFFDCSVLHSVRRYPCCVGLIVFAIQFELPPRERVSVLAGVCNAIHMLHMLSLCQQSFCHVNRPDCPLYALSHANDDKTKQIRCTHTFSRRRSVRPFYPIPRNQ